MSWTYITNQAVHVSDVRQPNLEGICYNGKDCDPNRLIRFAGGSVSNLHQTITGLACTYTAPNGDTFDMTPGSMLVRVIGTTKLYFCPCPKGMESYYLERGDTHEHLGLV